MTANIVEVSASDFARMNKGLITVLKAIQKAGDDGIPTRKLLYDEVKMIGHGELDQTGRERRSYQKKQSKTTRLT